MTEQDKRRCLKQAPANMEMMKQRRHGGDRVSYIEAYGKEPLDFSESINPCGLPEGVAEAFSAAAADISYPDPDCRVLRRAIAEKAGTDPGAIICGNGASDLIFRFFYATRPGRVLLPLPTYSDYLAAAEACGAEVVPFFTDPEGGFALDRNILPRLTGDIDALVLISPGNPTGQLISFDLLSDIFDVCREKRIAVIVDTCFLPFSGAEAMKAMTVLQKHYSEAFFLSAFTKIYAMAGMRLGWGTTGDTGLLNRMAAAGPSWNVSGPAQAGGIAALSAEGYIEKTVEFVRRERAFLAAALTGLGLNVLPSDSDSLMFSADVPLMEGLLKRGIMIRDLNGEPGIDEAAPWWYRIGVKSHENNLLLIAALEAELKPSCGGQKV